MKLAGVALAVSLIATLLVYSTWQKNSQVSSGQMIFEQKNRAIYPELDILLADSWVHVKDLQPKVLWLHYWASWCGPCLEELPILEKALAQVSTHDVQLLLINVDKKKDRKTATDLLKPYQKLLALNIFDHKSKYVAQVLPSNDLLDANRKLAARFFGNLNLVEVIPPLVRQLADE